MLRRGCCYWATHFSPDIFLDIIFFLSNVIEVLLNTMRLHFLFQNHHRLPRSCKNSARLHAPFPWGGTSRHPSGSCALSISPDTGTRQGPRASRPHPSRHVLDLLL